MIFTPSTTILGGLVLGTASFYYRFFYGRSLGISGFLNSRLALNAHDGIFKWLFLLGLASFGGFHGSELKILPLSPFILSLSGFLVGFGTRMGNGCTSGHGLCGLPRFSYRSLAAVLSFMATGMITRTLTMDMTVGEPLEVRSGSFDFYTILLPVISLSICQISYWVSKKIRKSAEPSQFEKIFLDTVSILWGMIFGNGLLMAGMTSQQKVFDFLSFPTIFFRPHFDPSLALVMGAGIVPNLIGHFIFDEEKPFMNRSCHLCHPSEKITPKLIIGAAIFGIGWGLGGICPGPGVVLLGNEIGHGKIGNGSMIVWMISMFVGSEITSFFW